MHYVYILISEKDHLLYIGYCADLKVRFDRHQKGYVRATKHRRPLRLIYYEAYVYPLDAKRREKYLKGGNGRATLKIQLKEVFQKVGYRQR